MGFPSGSKVKDPSANVGDAGSIPRSGRSPGKENGNPLQCSCLGNLMGRGVWWATIPGVTQSWTELSDETTTSAWISPQDTCLVLLTLHFLGHSYTRVNFLLLLQNLPLCHRIRRSWYWKTTSYINQTLPLHFNIQKKLFIYPHECSVSKKTDDPFELFKSHMWTQRNKRVSL